ncbi:MAG: histone deacetylase [Spirochaetota bacterium]
MKTAIATCKEFWQHDTGSHHPEQIARLTSIQEKIEITNYYPQLLQVETQKASQENICRIHSQAYYDHFFQTTAQGSGYFDPDTPFSQGSQDAALLAAGTGIALADSILAGKAKNGIALVRPPGHHAEKDKAMGFCLFNNVAIAARYLQSQGFEKIFIIDWDVHHGNGTENAFYEDDSVFFVSSHQYPFYPGSGHQNDTGSGKGKGFNKNYPLQRGTGNEALIDIFQEQIVKELDSFQPDCILLSAGFDAHIEDPLGGLTITTAGFETLTQIVKTKAEELCQGRLVSFLEGGYNLKALAESVEAHLAVLAT